MKPFVTIFLIFLVTMFGFGCELRPVDDEVVIDEEVIDEDVVDEDVVDEDVVDGLPAALAGVRHFKQSTIRIEGDLIIYFDPYQYPEEPQDADVIFITHSHSDHFSSAAISNVSNAGTVIVAPESMAQEVENLGLSSVKTVMPGMQYSVKGLSFEATFAYNTGSRARHSKSKNWVGYVVTMGDTQYYIAGDTDFVSEIESVKADVVFLPVGGGSSMDASEAAAAAKAIKPSIAIPIHYGVTSGSTASAEQFVELLPDSIAGYIYSDDGELRQ